MIKTKWLSSLTIADKDARITVDIYGVSNDKVFLIESRSYQNITAVIDAWSF